MGTSPFQNFMQALQARHAKEAMIQQHEEFEKQHDLAQQQLKEIHEQHSNELDLHRQEMEQKQGQLDLQKSLVQRQLQHEFNTQVGGNPGSVTNQPQYQTQLPSSVPTQSESVNQGPGAGAPPPQFQNQDPKNFGMQTPRLVKIGAESGLMTPEQEKLLGGKITVDTKMTQDQIDAEKSAMAQLNPIIAAQAGAVEGAKATAQFPTKVAELQAQYEHTKEVANINAKARENAAQISAIASYHRAQLTAGATRYAADMRLKASGMGDDTDFGQEAANVAGGLSKPLTGPRGLHMGAAMSSLGYQPGDHTQTLQFLKAQKAVEDIPDKIDEIADKYLYSDSFLGQLGTAARAHATENLKWPSDLKSELDSLFTKAITQAKANESLGGSRVTQQQLTMLKNGMMGMNLTRENAHKQAQSLRELAENNRNGKLSGLPESQKSLLLHNAGYGSEAPSSGKKFNLKSDPGGLFKPEELQQ